MTKETDRELLELAAKAYWGDEIDDVCSIRWLEIDQCIGFTHGDNQDHNGQDVELCWNPLESDGDALRLAVKLGLVISPSRVTVMAYEPSSMARDEVYEPIRPDPLAATRRAIVRAAAEIGRAMP